MNKKIRGIILVTILMTLAFLTGCVDNNEEEPPIYGLEVSIIFNTETSDVTVDTINGLSGEPVTKPENPIREGYKFSHWELNGSPYIISIFPNRTIILTAVWNKEYTIIFEVGDFHEPVMPINLAENEPINELPKLSYKIDNQGKGYKFLYWMYEGVKVPFEVMPEMDILLDAKWEETLIISFNTGLSDDFITPIFADVHEEITAPNEVPLLTGQIFMGWTYFGKPYIFDVMPSQSIQLEAHYMSLSQEYASISSLPKMFINLDNNAPLSGVNRESYIDSSITVQGLNTDDLIVSAKAEFKGRGHGSWTDSGPKRGYRIKFNSKQSLFGIPKSKHWVLLAGANFYDPTLAKNTSAFSLANNVFDNIEYASSTEWVELYVNGEYRGVYILAEHTRVDKNRVNIKAEYGVLDTGYLLEYDVYASEDGPEGLYYFNVDGYKHPFAVKSPDPDDIYDEGISENVFRSQVEYIKNYTTIAMRAAINKDLTKFIEYVDIDSVIDMYLLHELYKNTDAGWSSFFLAKKPGGKLYLTAPWDFDASAGSNRGDTSPQGFFVSDTIRSTSSHTASELFISLMEIPAFKTMVGQRWNEISDDVKAHVNLYLSDSFIEENKFSFGQNFKRWSGIDPGYGSYPNIEVAQDKWSASVRELRNWLISRSNWFDNTFK